MSYTPATRPTPGEDRGLVGTLNHQHCGAPSSCVLHARAHPSGPEPMTLRGHTRLPPSPPLLQLGPTATHLIETLDTNYLRFRFTVQQVQVQVLSSGWRRPPCRDTKQPREAYNTPHDRRPQTAVPHGMFELLVAAKGHFVELCHQPLHVRERLALERIRIARLGGETLHHIQMRSQIIPGLVARR